MTAPQTARRTKDDLSGLLSSLIERGVADDQNFPVLRRLSDETWEVSFDGAEHVSIAMGDIDYRDLHRELGEDGAYLQSADALRLVQELGRPTSVLSTNGWRMGCVARGPGLRLAATVRYRRFEPCPLRRNCSQIQVVGSGGAVLHLPCTDAQRH